jgi:hypothetical protein
MTQLLKHELSNTVPEILALGVGGNSAWFQHYLTHSLESLQHQVNVCTWLKCMHNGKCESFADIGSAPFALPYVLKKYDIFSDVSAFDIDPSRFDNIDKFSFKIEAVDIEKDIEISRNFDIIYFSHIFEHLRTDLILTMNNLKSLMDQDSLLYIETPNGLGLKTLRNVLAKGVTTGCASDLYEEWSKIHLFGHMGHVREYGKGELLSFFDNLDLRVEATGYSGVIPPVTVPKAIASTIQKICPSLKNDVYFVLSKK